jgi:pimeloyl-ACP methyl ester carboxylesterase
MNTNTPHIPDEYVVPLNMNGLKGRLVHLPAKKKKREILFVYGHHSSLERWYSLAQVINDYGAVTMPDLPGFGDMDSFYKIGEKPDLDTMADYLASVIKLRLKNRRITLAGLSYGFLVVTRMLQRYPDIAKRTDFVISLVGFTHEQDLLFSHSRRLFYRSIASVFSLRLTAGFFHGVVLHPFFLRTFYSRTHSAKHKFKNLDEGEKNALTEFEIELWHNNDVRTYMATAASMLKLNNCTIKVDMPVWHIGVKADNFLDKNRVEEHMRMVFSDFHYNLAPLDGHTPNVIAGKAAMAELIPASIKKVLRKAS